MTRNLAEGALIVIFVLVLFLGNWRAGLVVASVIPLAMLFAISLMRVFNVSGNLLSLGAASASASRCPATAPPSASPRFT